MTEQHEFNPNEWQDSGAKWADGFRKIILDQGIPVDEDLMLGWFCNAIEIAHTHRLQTDTRPSASREEIAMAIGFASRHKFDVSKDAAEFWEHLSSDGRRWYLRMADAVLGIQPTPTPGNTDPMLIAKYDDELRKVQEFLEDFTSHHFEEVRRWNGPSPEDELDPVTESGMVLAFQEDAKALLDKLATPQPEAQPSVRAGAVDALAAYQQADQDGIMVLVSRQAIEECLPALRSLAQEGE